MLIPSVSETIPFRCSIFPYVPPTSRGRGWYQLKLNINGCMTLEGRCYSTICFSPCEDYFTICLCRQRLRLNWPALHTTPPGGFPSNWPIRHNSTPRWHYTNVFQGRVNIGISGCLTYKVSHASTAAIWYLLVQVPIRLIPLWNQLQFCALKRRYMYCIPKFLVKIMSMGNPSIKIAYIFFWLFRKLISWLKH